MVLSFPKLVVQKYAHFYDYFLFSKGIFGGVGPPGFSGLRVSMVLCLVSFSKAFNLIPYIILHIIVTYQCPLLKIYSVVLGLVICVIEILSFIPL